MSFIQRAASRTTDWLVQGGGITEAEREVHEYGLDKLFSSLVHFLFTASVGFLFGIPGQTMLFFVTYYIIRIYAGGYHAKTKLMCFVTSVVIMILTLAAIKFWHVWFSVWAFYALLILSGTVLLLISPVANKNKMLDGREKTVYRRCMIRNIFVAFTAAVTMFHFLYHSLAVPVLFGVLLAALMAVAGKVKLWVENENAC